MSFGADLPTDLDVDLAGLSALTGSWFARMPVADQRIQSAPDGRTLRFYQSTGLLDRPLRYDGRVARYGRRHLLQLLAIRALQSSGHSLAQVQTSLAGAADTELAQVVGKTFGNPLPEVSATPPPTYAIPVFKTRPPAAQSSPTPHHAAPVATPTLVAAELAPGVVITIDSRFQTDPARVIAVLRRAIQGEET
ncbi:MAG: helix-turn-helix domain-containing protein [Gemmatimonas sp.]